MADALSPGHGEFHAAICEMETGVSRAETAAN